ncbi:MAG: agmatine deiminase family protein [Acidimicrobiales bacterium]|jgi:agmatine deiminase
MGRADGTTTPADDGFRMPPETARHERTLMGWPCRTELWKEQIASARSQYAGVANAVAEFEPVTMVVTDAGAAAGARAMLSAAVEIIELPLDDSWMRDNGPFFTLDSTGRRAGVHFRFNAWGQKFEGWSRDEAAGGALARRFGDVAYEMPVVLEGGSVIMDAAGQVLTTEQCLLNPNRNPELDRDGIERALRDGLGATGVVWLANGEAEDRDTDGHIDGIAVITDSNALILLSRPPGDPDHEPMADNRARAVAAGYEVIDFPVLAHDVVDGERVSHSYLNLYLCNGAAIVPTAGGPSAGEDEEAVERLREALPGREVVGVPALVVAYGGGGPHCITQQVPARVGGP